MDCILRSTQSSSCLNDGGSGTSSEIVSLVTTKGEIHIMLYIVNYDGGRAMFVTNFLKLGIVFSQMSYAANTIRLDLVTFVK